MKLFCGILVLIASLALGETFFTEKIKITDGQAVLLVEAPDAVKAAVDAANRIAGKPYKYAGGHGIWEDDGYDCSGSTSYVLHAAGVLDEARSSSGFKDYGEPGPGEWISVHVKPGHVFLVIAGARFDTTDHADIGPGWREADRLPEAFEIRHPKGM